MKRDGAAFALPPPPPPEAEFERERFRLTAKLRDDIAGERIRRKRTGRVAGMYPGFFDMLHNTGDVYLFPVTESINIILNASLKKAIQQNRMLLTDFQSLIQG